VNGVARLNADGTLDAQFAKPLPAIVNGAVYSVKPQEGGKILIGGGFTEVNGVPKRYLARLDAEGGLDDGFSTDPDGVVMRMAFQPDGKIVIAGRFTHVNGIPRHHIARLLSDGSVDITFQNGLAGVVFSQDDITQQVGFDDTGNGRNNVYALVIQSDSRILVGGNFTNVDGVSRPNLARLNADGSLDTTFRLAPQITQDPTYDWIGSIAIQPTGNILIGGYFWGDDYGSHRQWFSIARLLPDGSLDTSFYLNAVGQYQKVSCIGLQSDGKIIMGSYNFYQIGTAVNPSLVRLFPDGGFDRAYPVTSADLIHILPDDSFFTAGTSVRKFDSNGILVTNFSNALSDNNYAGSFAWCDIESDQQGKVLVTGYFTKMNGAAMPYLARLWGNDHPPVLKIPKAGTNGLDVSWHAISNRTYRVQYTENLLANDWHDMSGDVCATNDLAGKIDVAAGTANQRYYRVWQLP
jgi:uncharacterized delta-60 repeat protein